MSQRFRADGSVTPVTIVSVAPCVVTDVKTQGRDGYNAIQVGGGVAKHLAKPQAGHLKDLSPAAVLREFRMDDVSSFARGQVVPVDVFVPGDLVTAIGTSKGRGFQGVVKRHGFHGHPTTHGHKDQTRMPGSIGSKRQGPVAPGKRMAGRMGSDRVTIKNLEVIEVDAAKGLIALRGAVPGARGGLLILTAPGTMQLQAQEAPVTIEAPAPVVETEIVSEETQTA